jgi:hypothetical protein
MAYTDEQVEQWFKNNLDASEVEIVRAMQVSGVDPAQVSRVTGADPGYVASRFEAFTTAGPPSPAVSPVVANPISLTPEGTASLGQPTNVSSPANVFSPADYGPPSPIFDPAAEIQRMQAQRVEAERLKQIELERPIVDPRPQPYVDTVAQNLLGRFDQEMDAAMVSGDYANVANVMKEAEGLYGPATYSTVADYLNTNPRYEGLRGQVGGAAYTPENLQSFVSSIPAPVDPGIAGALPGGPGDTGAGAGAGAGPGAGPGDTGAGAGAGPGSAAASPSRVYQPTYTSYRQEGQAPFGGYYTQPGISPYGGVFGVGTEQFEQQSDPFSGAQARARSLINNRLTPLTDNIPIDARQPGAFGGDMAANGVAPSPFAYRQTLSPNTLAALAAEATPASEAAASEATMRRGGYIDQGIAAVRR